LFEFVYNLQAKELWNIDNRPQEGLGIAVQDKQIAAVFST